MKEALNMEKVIDLMPHLEKKTLPKNPVYAIITIPAVVKKPPAAKHSVLNAIAVILDMAVSFGLGASLLIFLLLLMISL